MPPPSLMREWRPAASSPALWERPDVEIKELGHLVLYVRNLERSTAFYRDVLGWRQIFPAAGEPAAPGVPAAAVLSGRTHHELLLIEVGDDAAAVPHGRRVGLYHF